MSHNINDESYFWGGVACVMILSGALISSFIFDFPGGTAPIEEPVEIPSAQEVSRSPLSPPLEPKVSYSERDVECLALNSYFESRSQSVAGQVAVAQVVLNRVAHPKFPNNICEVIQQGPTFTNWKGNEMPVRNQCHFSWWCDGLSDIPKDEKLYASILSLMETVLESKMLDFTDGSLYYHADYVNPWWVNSFSKTMVIDDHVFYKESDD